MTDEASHHHALRQAAIAMRIGDVEAFRSPIEDAEWCIRAYLEASGLVLVPKEPTAKMLHAAAKAMSPGRRPTDEWVSVSQKHTIRYTAMIEAFKGPFDKDEEAGE